MAIWTVFVDESGLFEPGATSWLPATRLVAGAASPLDVESAGRASAAALAASRGGGSPSGPVSPWGRHLEGVRR